MKATVKIEAQSISKRFGRHWIVYNFSYSFNPGDAVAISGPNGSGKSTLLKLLSGQLLPSDGKLMFSANGKPVDDDELYQRISLAGPYVELIDELSGLEALDFHRKLRGFRQNLSQEVLWERIGWAKRIHKQTLSSYSSGMKQRLRILLALATNAQVVFLDEPTSNLDAEGVAWYQQLVEDWLGDRTLIVASNEQRDFVKCTRFITQADWQK